MASGGNSGPSTGHTSSAAAFSGPRTLSISQSEAAQSKRDLAHWWKSFKRGNPRVEEGKAPQGIFGVPLQQSIRYANVAISLFNDEGQSYIYGYVPIVVAKCGVFLKEKAVDVEGIFRLAGSEKRIKELKAAFDSPDRYGKGLDWTGYTVHDAANILRRYFNQLPEPIIPLEFYERFRGPIRNHQQQAVGAMESQSPDKGTFDPTAAIRAYQGLITELPPLNRQLLLYILDLLAVFASKSELNKMTTPNLAAIFQPGLLSHPQHDMAPQEYRLSQDVLIFLIENQDSFLVGMPGTAADEKTVKEVQSGAPTPVASSPSTPNKAKPLGRSNSNASAGADSIKKWGSIRRNASVSSKRSRNSVGGQGSQSPSLMTPVASNSGVYRSNTVPSKRSVSGASPRFQREQSIPSTPSPSNSVQGGLRVTHEAPANEESLQTTPLATQNPVPTLGSLPAVPQVISASSSETTTPLAAPGNDTPTATLLPKFSTAQEENYTALAPPSVPRDGSSERSASAQRNLLDIFKQSPGSSDGEKRDSRQPRKLQKKRIPGSALSSAQSSAADLQSGDEYNADSPITPTFQRGFAGALGDLGPESQYTTARSTPRSRTPQRQDTDTTIRAAVSPPRSYRSTSATDMSESDFTDDGFIAEQQKEKRRWRFSQSTKPRTGSGSVNLKSVAGNDHSRSTLASSSGGGTRSIQGSQEMSPPSTHTGTSPPENVLSDSEEKKKGPMSWIRGKIAERKERDAEKRAKSPMKTERSALTSESRQSLHRRKESTASSRGKSLEVPRASMSQNRNVPVAAATTTAANTAINTPSAPQTPAVNTASNTPFAPSTVPAATQAPTLAQSSSAAATPATPATTATQTPAPGVTTSVSAQPAIPAAPAPPATTEPATNSMPPPPLPTPPKPVQSAPVATRVPSDPQELELEKKTTAVPVESTTPSEAVARSESVRTAASRQAVQNSENQEPTAFRDIGTVGDVPETTSEGAKEA
ncbi:hypothetical protein MBLNU457_g1128t1 [Dothideomycetes sp. NU457]